MIVTLAGKGGAGKTSLAALILDELARQHYPGPVLAVDGDPATTLHLALGLPAPPVTVADIRETTILDARTIRSLPAGLPPARYVLERLQAANVVTAHELRGMPLHLLAMGQGEGAGCYCSINNALSRALTRVMDNYSLVLIDNEAGVEHLSRYRLKQVDLFLLVTNPTPAAQAVSRRILRTARQVQMELGEVVTILNRATSGVSQSTEADLTIAVSNAWSIYLLGLNGQPVVNLAGNDPARRTLKPIVERLFACA